MAQAIFSDSPIGGGFRGIREMYVNFVRNRPGVHKPQPILILALNGWTITTWIRARMCLLQ